MDAFAERARGELLATGEKVRRRNLEPQDLLTPQEAQVAQLASDGLTNPDIGKRLYLSARTVEWHLSKIFAKLGVNSRRELHAALMKSGLTAMPGVLTRNLGHLVTGRATSAPPPAESLPG